ncbi:hypothetical protein AB4Y85_13870 [Microvirga sp. 2YAF29]|uniref:hypothetical protein n=1 Tax=Microvirga sp. 2YAF29 TaxID=3233031 RepID=UPI003F94944B
MSDKSGLMKNLLEDHEYIRWVAIGDDFDEAYYCAKNPDVAQSGIDARLHYLRTGWLEGRNPNTWFDSAYYLLRNADVVAAQVNPLLHYVWQGRLEGRITKRPHDAVRTIIERARPSHHRAVHFPQTAPLPDEIDYLIARISEHKTGGLVVSFGHDDYAENIGGVQRLTGEEATDYAASGWQYLHLSPARPLPMLSPERELDHYIFSVRLDGDIFGPANAAQILTLLIELSQNGRAIDFIIHHLMGQSPEVVATICNSVADAEAYFWLHDFYALCSNHNLLRNDWKYCHAPGRDSTACRICAYGRERSDHLERIAHLFEQIRPSILAPSQTPLSIWLDRSSLDHNRAYVVSIGKLVVAEDPVLPRVGGPLRIAFIGHDSHAKGWTTFQALLDRFSGDARYDFIRLGVEGDTPSGDNRCRHIHVRADRDDRDAMTLALAENEIDAVLLWPAWPETFSYAAHEVLAAGSFLITHADAGNVPSVLAAYVPLQGVVLENVDELFELFAAGDRLAALLKRPRQQGVILPHQNTTHMSLKRHAVLRDQRQSAWMETALA